MMDMRDFALNMISRNPNVANNPNAQEFINVIRSGDEERGKQIAANICQNMGVSQEEGIGMAKKFFGL